MADETRRHIGPCKQHRDSEQYELSCGDCVRNFDNDVQLSPCREKGHVYDEDCIACQRRLQ